MNGQAFPNTRGQYYDLLDALAPSECTLLIYCIIYEKRARADRSVSFRSIPHPLEIYGTILSYDSRPTNDGDGAVSLVAKIPPIGEKYEARSPTEIVNDRCLVRAVCTYPP